MKNKKLAILIISALLMSACNPNNSTETPTPDANSIYTMAAQTVVAMSTMVAATLQTTMQAATVTPGQPLLPTVPSTPATPTAGLVIATALPAAYTAAPSSSSCDRASFVSDVTIPDGTVISAGSTFTKTWRLMNAGSCTWGTGYALVFVGGTSMGGTSPLALSTAVPPGATIDVSETLTAPSTSQTYTGNWMLQNAAGTHFGIGGSGTGSFYVNIVVNNGTTTGTPGTPTPTISYFAVRSLSFSASQTSYTGYCPATITLSGSMVVSQAGTVTYHYQHSDGSTIAGSQRTLTPSGGGSISFSDTIQESLSDTVTLYVDQPNNQAFGQSAAFTITCSSATATPTPTTGAATSTPTNTTAPTNTPTHTPTTPTPTTAPSNTPQPTNTPTPH